MIQIETVLEKIVSTLQANLQTKLTAITVSEGDGITLTAPRTNEYYIHEIDEIGQMSAIVVKPTTTSVTIPGGSFNEDDHDVSIVVIVRGLEGSIDKCAKRAYRFARAVREIIFDNQTLGDTVVGFHATGIDYSPMMSDNYSLLMTINVDTLVQTHETN